MYKFNHNAETMQDALGFKDDTMNDFLENDVMPLVYTTKGLSQFIESLFNSTMKLKGEAANDRMMIIVFCAFAYLMPHIQRKYKESLHRAQAQ